ncbi:MULTISPECIES: AraC-like ligand-binding domain-containing protein [unclassified Rhizobium]|uniref:AraC-like ligand-binding domain-containing protein n=1 Tax=unclassified Rhizobium TaxID=2613769 RepID=UPI001ADBE79C|nr:MULTISPECIES: helix-turn-helix domain-containing protein [unclassified Rhizobium]MBO9123748.1 helix-turn-helix domain-containing protein [Rhizobium sp. 16-488-2b]MBO9174280.1 helix-turn-helix domain-containing protein [Rhizobium sp. 16-488-2a]
MSFHYSTADLSQSQRAKYWHDSVAAQLIPAEAKYGDPHSFQGSLRGGPLAGLTICEMKAQPHTFVRTAQIVRRAPDEDFVATFLKEGSMRYCQNGRMVEATAGSIVLLDAGRPFKHEMGAITSLILRIPRRRFLARFPQAERLTGVELAQDNPMTGLLHQIAEEALRMQANSSANSAETRFASALMDLLIVTMEQSSAGDAGGDSNRYEMVRRKASDFIDAQLDDYELSIETISSATGTSSRTLARAFAADGRTVMQHVWKRRLDASFALLSERRVAQVTQAAYQCGFNDLSHFARAFKLAFGVTPGAVLRGVEAREGHRLANADPGSNVSH